MLLPNILIVAKQVAILYIIVAVGALADKTGLFTETTAKRCTDLLFYIITPAVIIQSFLDIEFDADTARGLFLSVGCGLLFHTVAALIKLPFFRKGDQNRNAVFKYACVHGNCGYMALPLAQAVLGTEGVFYCSAVIVSFQIFSFTSGVWLMSGDKNVKGTGDRFQWKKIILNPGVLSVLVGLPLFLLRVKMPEILYSPIHMVASMNSPLAMLIFGTYMAHTNFRRLFREKEILLVALLKLICLPVIMLFIYKGLLGIGGTLLASVVLSSSAPPANNTVIFAAKYDKDTSLASLTVSSVSLLAIFTMPVLIAYALTS